jgi:hypothetical protein
VRSTRQGAGVWPGEKPLRRANTKIPVIGDLGGSAARPFAQISLGIGLQAPGDAAKQELLVRGFRFFAEQFPVLFLEPGHLRPGQLIEYGNDGWVHGWVSFLLLFSNSSMDALLQRESKRIGTQCVVSIPRASHLHSDLGGWMPKLFAASNSRGSFFS